MSIIVEVLLKYLISKTIFGILERFNITHQNVILNIHGHFLSIKLIKLI